ncbi:MAG TPA: serine hydrolase domain-containing protein [Verrucomicrobiae bacterium]|nr:serine hydrolase domain-containing protein [Verrucomicrobiae bacterium]
MKFAALLLSAALAACATAPREPAPLRGAELDARIEALMAREQVVGMAVAVIDGDEITHVGAYGLRNREQALPLGTDTIMYGASVTKAAFAYMVMQLVDEGRIDLDRSIAEYLPRPLPEYEDYTDLAGDERWRQLTPRILLTHRSGFANMRWLDDDQKLRFHFTPGEHYAYSNEGIWVLQVVLEQGLGLDTGAEMQRRVFDRFGMTRTSMQWRDDFAGNLADGYAMDGTYEPHDRRDNVAAAGSMDTTITDQARMWRAMFAGEGLSPAMREEWVRAQFPIRTTQKFPTIQFFNTNDLRGEASNLSASMVGETWTGPDGARYFSKGGHNDWTGNLVICAEAQQRCLVMFGNSVRAEMIYPELAALVLGETNFPFWWIYPELQEER